MGAGHVARGRSGHLAFLALGEFFEAAKTSARFFAMGNRFFAWKWNREMNGGFLIYFLRCVGQADVPKQIALNSLATVRG